MYNSDGVSWAEWVELEELLYFLGGEFLMTFIDCGLVGFEILLPN
jgi:hypothetical protein